MKHSHASGGIEGAIEHAIDVLRVNGHTAVEVTIRRGWEKRLTQYARVPVFTVPRVPECKTDFLLAAEDPTQQMTSEFAMEGLSQDHPMAHRAPQILWMCSSM